MTSTQMSLTRALGEWRDIIGVPVAVMTMTQVLDLLEKRITESHFTPVAFLNANNSNISRAKPELSQAFDHFLTLSDGVGVDLASWLLHGAMFPDNLNGTDLVPQLFQKISRPLKVSLIGARREVADCARSAFAQMCPQHEFDVVADGYFKPQDEPAILAGLAEARPDVLLVAMGVPRQEMWIAKSINSAHCTVPIAVGALFDIFTGTIPRAPEWMLKLRIEWLYRLWKEPKRLWRRYVIGNPAFLFALLKAKAFGTSPGKGHAYQANSVPCEGDAR